MWKKKISEHFSTDFTDADILPTRLILCRCYSHAEIIPTKTMFTQNFSPHYLYRTPKYLCRHYSHKSKFYSKIIKSGIRLSSHTISSYTLIIILTSFSADVLPTQILYPQRLCLCRPSFHTTFIKPPNIYAVTIPTRKILFKNH